MHPQPANAARSSAPRIIVQKYGGSSVADVARLGRVADRVAATRRAGFDVVVVVSAMGKTTDGLMTLAREVARQGGQPDDDGDPPRRALDMLVSTGERVSMSLLSIAIQARGLDAICFTGSQSGIITNDRHFDARIIEVRPHRIEDELARGRVVIVAGYQGMSYKREITTLGRGGTDTTAVALAAALDAVRCEIYSDVDGVYSADPRLVADAVHLPEVDYETLQEMAEAGAKVVCAQAVEWARRSGVAIYARSTFDPIAAEPRQTIVRRFAPPETPRARAVTTDGALALLETKGGALGAVLGCLAPHAVPVREIWVGGDDEPARVMVSLRNAPEFGRAEADLVARGGVVVRRDVTVVSVIGAGLGERAERVLAFHRRLARERVVFASASPLRLSAGVVTADVTPLVADLHAAFVA
ncbi:MAG: aspartate kinase [Myxococcota bacterium]